MDDKTRNRKWLLTINNPKESNYLHENIKAILSGIKNLGYWCMCDEIGRKGTYHTHLFIYRNNALRFSQIKKAFPTAHIDYCRGTCQENRDYIRKEGKYKDTDKEDTNLKDTFEEYGVVPDEQQGRRNDLHGLYGMIKDGMSDFEILEEDANYMTKLDTISKVRETLRYEQFSKCLREVTVEYWYGKSGTGKTSGVLNKYGFGNVYVVDDYKHPWDNYRGEDVVLFDEFDAFCYNINQILRWLDRYPVALPCRYNNKQACYTKVYFTSNRPLEEQYFHLRRENPETFNALLRRFTCFKVFDENGYLKEYHDFDSYTQRWQQVAKKDTPFKQPEQNKQLDLSECEFFANAQESKNKGN